MIEKSGSCGADKAKPAYTNPQVRVKRERVIKCVFISKYLEEGVSMRKKIRQRMLTDLT